MACVIRARPCGRSDAAGPSFNAINSMRNTRDQIRSRPRPKGFNAINSIRNTRRQLVCKAARLHVSTLSIACEIRARSLLVSGWWTCFNAINSMRNARIWYRTHYLPDCFSAINSMQNTRLIKVRPPQVQKSFNAINSMRNTRVCSKQAGATSASVNAINSMRNTRRSTLSLLTSTSFNTINSMRNARISCEFVFPQGRFQRYQ